MSRGRLKAYLLSVLGWWTAALLFLLIRFVGLGSVPEFRELDLDQIDHGVLVFRSLILGWILGSAFHVIDRLMDRPGIRRRPYGALILMQAAGNMGLVVLAVVTVSVAEMIRARNGLDWSAMSNRLFSTNFLVLMVYGTLVSFSFSFLKHVDRKFGPGNLWKLIIGMYHQPREEERIFMFLDLRGSTTHAEQLGHVQFSRLIQDCFIDLSVVIDHQAQVYQYVGDEVILFWEVRAGLNQASCLRAYFRFVDRLQARADHYQSIYGLAPTFKAGANIGSATVLEVGEIKREIAYLGDVLNTAARIQGKCNELGEDLLVSGPLLDRLHPLPPDLDVLPMGAVELRGRGAPVSIFSVRRKT